MKEPRQEISYGMVARSRNIYVFVTFTGNDETWVKVTKKEILHHLTANKQKMIGDIDQYGDMWISP